MQIKLAYIISQIDKALAFEWIAEELPDESISLCFILLNNQETALERFLIQKNIPVFRVNYSGKKDIPKAFFRLIKIFRKEKIRAIHCHLFDASLLGLMVGKLFGIPKRVTTRHHSSLHHVYFPRAVYYDKLVNFMATDIIAISESVKKILIEKEGVKYQKIHLVHHGFQLNLFKDIDEPRINHLRQKYQITNQSPIIGVIARQTIWKGIQYIIPAFQKLLEKYPEACLILANAKGDYKNEIDALLTKLPEKNYLRIRFEEDIFALYQLFDLHVHTPIDDHSEAFGQTYVEALAAKVPSVFTLSGVAAEFIKHQQNAWVVGFQNSEETFRGMDIILQDSDLRNKMQESGLESVQKLFHLSLMINKLREIYLN